LLVAIDQSLSQGRRAVEALLSQAAEDDRWDLLLEPSQDIGLLPFERHLDKADAILCRTLDNPRMDAIAAARKPTVALSARPAMPRGIPAVTCDGRLISEIAFAHLREQRFERLGFYGWGDINFLEQRSDRFLAKCEEAGVHADRLLISATDASATAAVEEGELAAWLSSLVTPVAIMTAKDCLAFQVVATCRRLGLRVPDDVAVIGSDNDEVLCEHARPTISAVDPGFGRIVRHAMQMLDAHLDDGAEIAPITLFPPIGVVMRGSTDVTAADDPEIREALRHIREEATRGITAEDVFARVGGSRRTFERNFRNAVGCSPLKAIHRRRIDEAKHLLVDTNLSVEVISRRVGYATLQNFYEAFRREATTTPRRFRMAAAEPEGEADDSTRTPPRQ
jgi:LacI family transcriptional regulator